MTMREWWANYYPEADGVFKIGGKFKSRRGAEQFQGHLAAFRIHVRLKPEGAPKRYLDDAERYAWEQAARRGETPRYS